MFTTNYKNSPEINSRLKERANFYCEELSEHSILKKYWDKLTVVLKGSTARGYSDKYSDVDFVLFCDDDICKTIISEYNQAGLVKRTDGVFLPLGEWEGHYNLDTYSHLEGYFQSGDIMNIWEYINVTVLHNNDIYKNIVDNGMEIFTQNIDDYITSKYRDIFLNIDWLRQPLLRCDGLSVSLYIATIIRQLCQIGYLLDNKPYPCDKWLFYEYQSINNPVTLDDLSEYRDLIKLTQNLSPDLDLMDYPLYAESVRLMGKVRDVMAVRFNDAYWVYECHHLA